MPDLFIFLPFSHSLFKPGASVKEQSKKIERELLKKMNTRFYHPMQKQWSVLNTNTNMGLLKKMFAGKYETKEEQPTIKQPKFTLNEASLLALSQAEQKLLLKGYSQNTIRTRIERFRSID